MCGPHLHQLLQTLPGQVRLACVPALGSFLGLPRPRLGWSEVCEPGAREAPSLFLGKLVSGGRFSAIVYYFKIFFA